MSESDAGRDERGAVETGVFLLPFALPEPFQMDGVDANVLARRLPDVLHQLLNAGRPGPAGMLEIQSPPGDGPPRWVTLSDVPSPDEVLPMLDAGPAGALVAGALRQGDGGLLVELIVHVVRDGSSDAESAHHAHGVHAVVRFDDPAGSLLRLAEHLAQLLRLPFHDPGPSLLTRRPDAFFRFLVALDGAALLSGDPELESERFGEELLRPLVDALRLDPGFGLALRTFAHVLFPALQGERVPAAVCLRLLDECLGYRPADGQGCVEVADQLLILGHDAAALAWLEHAVGLESPPSRAIESLGVQLANSGDATRARDLWRRGCELDGHPDFFAHLARLAFTEDHANDAWDLLLRGLYRKLERTLRAAEWEDDGRGASALLRYLSEHLEERAAPPSLNDAIVGLAGHVDDPIERVDLGLCLRAIGRDDLARVELRLATGSELSPSVEDRAVRALLCIDVPDFERTFRVASDRASRDRDPRGALVEMQACLDRQPAFWPAMLYAGVALRRLGREDEALDLMAEVALRRPAETRPLVEMAEMFDGRGNPKRALECIDDAIALRPRDSDFRVLRAQCLEHLGREDEAILELDRAIALEPRTPRARRRRGRKRA